MAPLKIDSTSVEGGTLPNNEVPSIDSFLSGGTVSVDDLMPDTSTPSVTVNTANTDKVVSAKVAALDGNGNALKTYGGVTNTLRDGDTSLMDSALENLKKKTFSQSADALTNILRDPSVSEKQKQKALEDYQNYSLTNFSLNKAVMTESLVADDEGENPRQERVRVNYIDAINEVNQSKREMQALLSREAAKTDPSTLKALKDIVTDSILPFYHSGYIAKQTYEDTGSIWEGIKAFVASGEAQKKMRDSILKASPEEQLALAKKTVDYINATGSPLPFEQNDYARLNSLRTALEDGYYTNTDRFVDDLISVLDLTILGGVALRAGRKILGVSKAAENVDLAREATRLAVRGEPDATSLSQVYKDTNISKAKATHEAVIADSTGEVADATYGVNRTDAIATDNMPQIDSEVVKNKVHNMDSAYINSITPSPELMDMVSSDGMIHYWKAEKERMRNIVVNDFAHAVGVVNRGEMSQVVSTPRGVNIKAVYGTPQLGYESAQEALETVKVALRDYGITDKDMKLLGRVGDTYVPMTVDEVNAAAKIAEVSPELKSAKPADYLVQVEHKYEFNPSDNDSWKSASVNMNFFDRMPIFTGNRQGSLARHLLDIASMLHPKLVLGANLAVDKAAGVERIMLEKSKKFSDAFVKLSKERQAVMHDYIKQANAEGIDLNVRSLKAQGFSDAEIDTLKTWRSYWDDMYWLDNKDLARTLNSQNFHWFVDPNHDTQMFARPVGRNKVGSHARVYNQRTGEVETILKDDLTKLYDEGGTIAQMRTPMKIGDEAVELIKAENKAGGSYLRRINDNDPVLQYRKGYYTVNYKAPKFIDKIVRDSRGNELYRQAVAVAGSTKDADILAAQMKKIDPVNDYLSRSDIRKEGYNYAQDGVDVLQAKGRTSQRVRGKRLEGSTMADEFGDNFVLSPVDSMVLAARTTSNRASMRDYLEVTKSRFMNQFGHLLQEDKFGRKLFPTDIKQITKPGHIHDKDIADARTTFEYINYLEKGYINGMDEIYKDILRAASDMVGAKSTSMAGKAASTSGAKKLLYSAGAKGGEKAEKALASLSEANPTGVAKGTTFNLFLASNPFRQIVVQSHQAAQLMALAPTSAIYMATKMPRDLILLFAAKFSEEPSELFLKTFRTNMDEYKELSRAWSNSGLSAAVDKNALINGSLSQLVEDARFKGKAGPVNKVFRVLRKAGFDLGEELNMMTSWLVHRDQMVKKVGKKLSLEYESLVTAKARNFTYNMNRAGDMPYNQNFLGMVFQFMQVPHKAMLTWTTNRILTPAEKARLIFFNATMYSLPPAAMYSWFGSGGLDVLPENQTARDVVVQGLESVMLNKALELSFGEKSDVDFSGLSPFDIHGVQQFITTLWTSDAGSILAASPAGSLLFGQNPRITEAAKTWARFFNLQEDDDTQDPVKLSELVKANVSMFSGMSNYFKAKYALETGKKLSASGNITDSNVSTPEAIMQMFGFPTMDETRRAWIGHQQYVMTKAFKDDVNEYYATMKKHLARNNISNGDSEYYVRTISDAWRVFGNDNLAARQIILDNLKKDASKGDILLFKRALQMTQWKDISGLETMVREIPDQEYGKKQAMLDTIEHIKKIKEE